jgi:serine/threonine protein kinase
MTQTVCSVCEQPLALLGAHLACAARAYEFALPERIGPYPIVRKIGDGGMGIVYAGQQHCPAREVAIKVIKDGIYASDALRTKFLAEREIAGRFEHPNIIRVYDAGEDEDGELYYVMELAQRGTLREFLACEVLSIRDAVRLMIDVAFAVDYAHQQGVLHRDLKPDNILISEDRRPRVTDFGVARLLANETEPSAACESTLVGSYPYMAPEQAGYNDPLQPSAASKPGPASDVYSLGAILYELVSGAPPYPVYTREELLEEFSACKQKRLPAALYGWASGADYDLEAVIMKALHHDRTERYCSAAAFAQDLRSTLGGRAPTAPRQGMRARLVSKLVHHAAWFSILLAALSISVGTIATLLTHETTQGAGVIGLIFAHGASVARQLAVDPMSSATLDRWRASQIRDEAWLERIARDNKLISTVFLLSMDGTPVAHYPHETQRYYQQHFKRRIYMRGPELPIPQGVGAFVSPLFRSHASDQLIKLAFSALIYGAHREKLGVAVVTIALPKLTAELGGALSLRAPCEDDLRHVHISRVQCVGVQSTASGELIVDTMNGPVPHISKADVARTHYQVVADLRSLLAIAWRDGLLLGIIALLCLCGLALFRRARTYHANQPAAR